MNYYQHHIGDYAEATAHLNFVEDAAYSRLIRKYYATEKPLPADIKAIQRLIGARSKEEREAVETVLNEFFTLEDDGWHNARCDEELDLYMDGSSDNDGKSLNGRERAKRHREQRAILFGQLRERGIHANWNAKTKELRELLKLSSNAPVTKIESKKEPEQEPTSNVNSVTSNAHVTLLVTANGNGQERGSNCDITATNSQEPITNNQEPKNTLEVGDNSASRMSANWRPTPSFKTLAKRSGLPLPDTPEFEPILAEFVAYWLSQNRTQTAAEWDHSLLKSMQAARAKSATSRQQPRVENFASINYGAGGRL